jgi:hypothetical protein
MDAASQPDLTHRLPRDLHYLVVHALRGALPPPVTNSPEDHAHRDQAIIADVASLHPANTAEAILASQCVAANFQSLDCLRLARLHPADVQHVLKCTAQSASMMRQSRGALSHLLRLQAAREKCQPDNGAIDTAALPVSKVEPPAPRSAPEDNSRSLTKAEEYARANPSRAALIRSLGRLPKKFDDATMTPDLLHDIVNSDSPILQALVKKPTHRLATAA